MRLSVLLAIVDLKKPSDFLNLLFVSIFECLGELFRLGSLKKLEREPDRTFLVLLQISDEFIDFCSAPLVY